MPFSFSFFLFIIFFFFFFRFSSPSFCRSRCSPSLFLFRSFCHFVLSFFVCFLYRLLRLSFRFPAFLGGGFCCSVISSRRYTPRALLASLKYAYFSCVLSLVFFRLFSSFPFSISIWTSFVSSCLSGGYYELVPPTRGTYFLQTFAPCIFLVMKQNLAGLFFTTTPTNDLVRLLCYLFSTVRCDLLFLRFLANFDPN